MPSVSPKMAVTQSVIAKPRLHRTPNFRTTNAVTSQSQSAQAQGMKEIAPDGQSPPSSISWHAMYCASFELAHTVGTHSVAVELAPARNEQPPPACIRPDECMLLCAYATAAKGLKSDNFKAQRHISRGWRQTRCSHRLMSVLACSC